METCSLVVSTARLERQLRVELFVIDGLVNDVISPKKLFAIKVCPFALREMFEQKFCR